MRVIIKKGMCIFILLFFVVSLVSASLSFTKFPESDYVLGEEVLVEIDIDLDTQQLRMIDFYLNCTDRELSFYRELLNPPLTEIRVLPSIVMHEDFLGTCLINAYLSDAYGSVIASWETNSFNVSNDLPLTFFTDKETYLPGEEVKISGEVGSLSNIKLHAELKEEGILVDYLNKSLDNSFFEFSFNLAENIPRGEKYILVEVEDDYENEAWTSKKIEVLQVAKRVELGLDRVEVNPSEDMVFVTHVYDQADDTMLFPIIYNVSNFENNFVDFFTQNSEEEVILTMDPYALPGEYTVHVSYDNLEDTKTFLVLELKKVSMNVREGIVYAKNIGNVDYTEEILINASSSGVVYSIPVSLNLIPGEEVEIDITSELPSQNYAMAFYSANESYFVEDVFVEDNRPLTKKISQGLSKITGASIINTDKTGNFLFLVFIIVIICFLLVFIFYKKFKKKFRKFFYNVLKGFRRGFKGCKRLFRKR